MTNVSARAILPAVKKSAQSDLFEGKREHGPRRTKHGGGIDANKRKLARPFRKNKPLHIVLKSSYVKGLRSLRSAHNKLAVEKIVQTNAKKQNAKLHAHQNVGNHLHILASFKTKAALTKFLKTIAALISRHVTNAKKGKPAGIKFWDAIPFSRIVDGLRDFRGMLNYILKNRIQAEYGSEAREEMERFERAEAKARKTGRPAFEFL